MHTTYGRVPEVPGPYTKQMHVRNLNVFEGLKFPSFPPIFTPFLLFLFFQSVLWSSFPLPQTWAEGPGLGNLFYSSEEVLTPISIISSPRGHGNVAMVNGYLMVIYSSDGGGTPGDGGIEFWDVSNPQSPQLVIQYDNSDTHGLREAHGFGFSNSYPKEYLVA